MGKKVGFTGADSTGKSTLIKIINPIFENNCRTETLVIGDIARSSPYPLVDKQNIFSSNWIFEQIQTQELHLQRTVDILICDRTILDVWIFSSLAASLGHISDNQLHSFRKKIRRALRTYDAIFYRLIDDTIPIRLENLPDSELKIRERFEEELLSSIKEFKHDTSFIELPTAHESCIDLIISTLKLMRAF